MMLQLFLLLAAALLAVGLFGALSQQSIVMVMMGLELMVAGMIVAAAAFWYFLAPSAPDGQVLLLVVLSAMTVEMAAGFAVVILLFRTSDADMTDMAAELKG
jgi:NAD(P)H-quinone oxidoreductase subunit 4L